MIRHAITSKHIYDCQRMAVFQTKRDRIESVSIMRLTLILRSCLDRKCALAIIRRAFFPEFLKNRYVRITIVIDFLCTAFAADASDVLRELAVERNRKCKKEHLKIGDVGSLS